MYFMTVFHRKVTILYVHYINADNEHWAVSEIYVYDTQRK